MTRLPVAGKSPAASERPKSGTAPSERYWHFSLRYWQQVDQFGVGDKGGAWFVALLNRLTDLCGSKLEEVLEDFSVKDALRIHDIDWNAKGIQTKLQDLKWVPDRYLGNQDEYPIMQIHISKANGRIIGFFDEYQVFNVVLLDPNHNLQPSKYSKYSIRPTRIGDDEVTKLRASYERAISSHQDLTAEIRNDLLTKIAREGHDDELVVVMRLNADQVSSLDQCIAYCEFQDAGEFLVRCVEEYATK